MIPKHELTAVTALVERLELTPALTPLQVFYKQREVLQNSRFRLDDEPGMHMARLNRVQRKANWQPREKQHPVLGDTHFALGYQARQLDALLDDWFAWAYWLAPAAGERVRILLKRAKEIYLHDRFIAAYAKHFGGYWSLPDDWQNSEDDEFNYLQGKVPWLSVSIKSVASESYELEFRCRDCGGFILSAPDDPDDSGPALCKACGRVFGSMANVKTLAQYIADTAAAGRVYD